MPDTHGVRRSLTQRSRRWSRGLARALVSLALLCVWTAGAITTPPSSAMASEQVAPLRILILGDSITQGSAGDWTWRYRLWSHLVESGVKVDFVGPVDDLFDRSNSTYGSHAYLDRAFDRDHASHWGNALGLSWYDVSELVSDYRPDVLVELLGVNDFAGLHASVPTVNRQLGDLVRAAREQQPNIAVVLGALGSDWIDHVPTFNAQLPTLAAQLDTPEARVVAADPPHLVRDVDTYEFVHPSASGEVKIAAEIADALATLGVGRETSRPLPTVPNGPRDAAVLSAGIGVGTATLTWSLPLGADRVYVEQRNLDARHPVWRRANRPILRPQLSTKLTGLVNGDHYRARVRAAKGTAIAQDIVSRQAWVRPGVPTPVLRLRVVARRHGFRATWGSSALATSYRITWWQPGHRRHAIHASTTRSVLVAGSLTAHRVYLISVRGLRPPFLGVARHQRVVPTS